MSASWCKVASNLDSNPRIRKAGRNGREVFLFALRRNAEPNHPTLGVVPSSIMEPWFLADQLMMPEADAVAGLSRAVAAGLLKQVDDGYEIVGWHPKEWGRETSTHRVQKHRMKQTETLHPVAKRSTVSDETPETDETNETPRGEERREEEKRQDQDTEPATPAARARARDPVVPVPSTKRGRGRPRNPDRTPAELASVAVIMAKLSEISGVEYRTSERHTALIVARLREGYTEWDLRRVVGYCAIGPLQWANKPNMKPYLRPDTLFGPQTIVRYIDPARTWAPAETAPEVTPLRLVTSQPATERPQDTKPDPYEQDDAARWEEPEWMTQ